MRPTYAFRPTSRQLARKRPVASLAARGPQSLDLRKGLLRQVRQRGRNRSRDAHESVFSNGGPACNFSKFSVLTATATTSFNFLSAAVFAGKWPCGHLVSSCSPRARSSASCRCRIAARCGEERSTKMQKVTSSDARHGRRLVTPVFSNSKHNHVMLCRARRIRV